MSNTYQNPYSGTNFPPPPFTSAAGQSKYSDTQFPPPPFPLPIRLEKYSDTQFPPPPFPLPIRREKYSDTQFPIGSASEYEGAIYLTTIDSSFRPVSKQYPTPGGILLSLSQYSYAVPFNTPEIILTPSADGTNSTQSNPSGFTYRTRADIVQNIGNTPPGSIFKNAVRNALIGITAGLGTPMTHQLSSTAISTIFKLSLDDDTRSENLGTPYSIMPFTRKKEIEEWSLTKYKDFRTFKGYVFSVDDVRIDGAAAAARNLFSGNIKSSAISGLFAATSAAPGGAYTLFNLESVYGFGNHGDTNAQRRDFTARTQVATNWSPIPSIGPNGTTNGKWIPTFNPIELSTEFRGDKINVIDFSQRKLSQAYQWKPKLFNGSDTWNAISNILNATDLTQDFIKFYFTGPKLQNGDDDAVDDIIVFRATIDSFSDSHSPSWDAVQMVGRADPNYIYTGYSRDVSLSFTMFATSRDEMKPMYRKINALAAYTAPDYTANTIAMKGPWLRMTIGDLLVQQPVVITSLQYTFMDSDTTWEINIEQDSTMMQVPHKVSVQLGLHVITDYLPEKGGHMYSLAKRYNSNGVPIAGGDNWLSDFRTNESDEKAKKIAENRAANLASITKKTQPGVGG
jgi:hypothetical protein